MRKSLKIHRTRANITRIIRLLENDKNGLAAKRYKPSDFEYYIIELDRVRDELSSLYRDLRRLELNK